jgi:hypothetical protein
MALGRHFLIWNSSMTNGPNAETLQRLASERAIQELKLDAERANQDIQSANDSARSAIQAAILINGGAATAILAYLSKDTHSAIAHAAAWSLGIYAIGVLCAALSLWCQTEALASFGHYRESKIGERTADAETWFKKGEDWLRRHWTWFGLSVLCFICSSVWMAREFYRATS